jgi:hypothetical protein
MSGCDSRRFSVGLISLSIAHQFSWYQSKEVDPC